jgi:hypothetical protein
MASFNVVRIMPESNPHLRAFDEIAEVLVASLGELGHRVSSSVNSVEADATNIVLGFHVLAPAAMGSLPEDSILYNFEQIDPTSMMNPGRLDSFTGFRVWDYSSKNVEAWGERGIDVVHVPLGHHRCLRRLDRSEHPTTDVLFYGSMNERRRLVLDRLGDAGLSVNTLFGVYGAERDAAIEDARLVVNIHYYQARILETARLFYLFANAVPVVSEWSEALEVPAGLEDSAEFAPFDRLVDTVKSLISDPAALAARGARGAAAMESIPMTGYLEQALNTSTPSGRDTVAVRRPSSGRAMNTSEQKRIIFVLGAHRSGTSMASRLVNLGGFELTGPTIPPAADNPAGFWEDQRIAIADDQLLRLLGSRWDDVMTPNLIEWDRHPVLHNLRADLIRHLQSSPADHLVLKDPRITILFPMWQSLVEDLGWKAQAVFSIRDPRAVAESLHTRNQFSRAKGIFIWLNYVLTGELYSRSTPRILVDYDTLNRTIDSAASKLHAALDMPAPLDQFVDAAIGSVDGSLNRSASFDPGNYRFPAAQLAQQVYDVLSGGADGRELDALRQRHAEAMQLVGPLLADYRQAISSLTDRMT